MNLIKQIPIVAFAVFLLGVAINMFLAPHEIAAGGVSGIGILAEAAFHIDRAIVVLVLNIILLVLAFIFLGKEIFFKTLLGSMFLPLALALVPEIMVTSDKFFSVFFGSAIFAVGVSILYRKEASSGGTTIPPLIFKKYFGLNTSIGLLATDMVIVVFSYFIFGIESFLFAIFSLVITSMIMNNIEIGFRKRKEVLILSEHYRQIADELLAMKKKTLRIIPLPGGYEHHDEQMLMIILENKDYPKIMKVIDKHDKKALVIAYNVSDVHGLGVTYQPII